MKEILLVGAALYLVYRFRNDLTGIPAIAANVAPLTMPAPTAQPLSSSETSQPIIGADLTGAAITQTPINGNFVNTGRVEPISTVAPLDIVGAANAWLNSLDALFGSGGGYGGSGSDPRYAPGVINALESVD